MRPAVFTAVSGIAVLRPPFLGALLLSTAAVEELLQGFRLLHIAPVKDVSRNSPSFCKALCMRDQG